MGPQLKTQWIVIGIISFILLCALAQSLIVVDQWDDDGIMTPFEFHYGWLVTLGLFVAMMEIVFVNLAKWTDMPAEFVAISAGKIFSSIIAGGFICTYALTYYAIKNNSLLSLGTGAAIVIAVIGAVAGFFILNKKIAEVIIKWQ